MAEKLTFSSVELDKLGRDNKGAWGTFSASLNSEVIGKMEWGDIPEFMTGTNLEGELTALSLELVPDAKEAKKHRIELSLAKVSGFNTVRRELTGKQGKGHRTVLHFRIICQDQEGAGKLERYKISGGKSKLIVSYEKAPKQGTIPGTETDNGCVACANDIPLEEDNPKKHVTGAKCTRRAEQQEMTQ